MNKKRTNLEIMLKHYHARMNEIRAQEAIDPLGMTETIEVTIELSTGGPADGFKLYLDKATRQPLHACYSYADWGWYEEEWLLSAEIDLVVAYFGLS